MARRKSNFDELTEVLVAVPWWVGPLVAGAVYGLLKFVGRMLRPSNPSGILFPQFLDSIALLAAAFVAMAWLVALGGKWMRRRRLDRQQNMESIRRLSWQEFELVVAEVFRRQGYYVAERGGPQADGGVDIVLTRRGKQFLVQCKHYRSSKVDVRVVRELAGVVAHDKADGGIVVVTGTFTKPAWEFARGGSITLMDGDALWEEIAELRRSKEPRGMASAGEASVIEPVTAATINLPAEGMTGQPAESSALCAAGPACPVCGAPMVRRKARRGPKANREFWGCGQFPRCRGIRAI